MTSIAREYPSIGAPYDRKLALKMHDLRRCSANGRRQRSWLFSTVFFSNQFVGISRGSIRRGCFAMFLDEARLRSSKYLAKCACHVACSFEGQSQHPWIQPKPIEFDIHFSSKKNKFRKQFKIQKVEIGISYVLLGDLEPTRTLIGASLNLTHWGTHWKTHWGN